MKNDTTKRRLGNVQQMPNGRWFARISNGAKVDGTRRAISKMHDTREEAEAWLVAKSVELGRRPDLGAGVTLRALWEIYERDKLPKLAKTTQVTYRQRMTHVLKAMGERDISTITHAEVQRMYDGMKPSVARRTNTVLSSVLTYAVRNELLAESPLYKAPFSYGETARFASPDNAVWDVDPFAAIEGARDVWDVRTALDCMRRIRGLALEPAWLACVGAGLRVEEAMALRKMDARRIVGSFDEWGNEIWVTQLAVHHATTREESRKATKTVNGSGIVPMLEPFGTRLWEIVERIANPRETLCKLSASRQNKAWRNYFAEPPKQWPKNTDLGSVTRGALYGLPYIPLSRMRATHTTIVQEAGILDSINQSMHRNTGAVQQRHYMRPDTTKAAISVSRAIQ